MINRSIEFKDVTIGIDESRRIVVGNDEAGVPVIDEDSGREGTARRSHGAGSKSTLCAG